MSPPSWRARHATATIDHSRWPVDPLYVKAVIEIICSDALLDGFTNMTTEQMSCKTGLQPALIDCVIIILIQSELVYLRSIADRTRRILEPGVSLRAVYHLRS